MQIASQLYRGVDTRFLPCHGAIEMMRSSRKDKDGGLMAQHHVWLGTLYMSNDVLLEAAVAQDGILHVGWADQNPQMLQTVSHDITAQPSVPVPPKLPME
jgi:hypothetical protein